MLSTSLEDRMTVVDVEAGVLAAFWGVVWLPPQPTRKIESTTTRITAAAMLTISTFRRLWWARRAGTGSLSLCIGLGGVSYSTTLFRCDQRVRRPLPPSDDGARLSPPCAGGAGLEPT